MANLLISLKILFRYKILKYLLIGFICAFVELSIFSACIKLVNIDWLPSFIASFIFAVTLNYYLCINFIFRSCEKYDRNKEITLFFSYSLIAVIINFCFLFFLIELLLIDEIISKIITMLFLFLFNYFSKKILVFGN